MSGPSVRIRPLPRIWRVIREGDRHCFENSLVLQGMGFDTSILRLDLGKRNKNDRVVNVHRSLCMGVTSGLCITKTDKGHVQRGVIRSVQPSIWKKIRNGDRDCLENRLSFRAWGSTPPSSARDTRRRVFVRLAK